MAAAVGTQVTQEASMKRQAEEQEDRALDYQ